MATPIRSSRAGIIDVALTGYFQDVVEKFKHVASKVAPLIDIDALGGELTIEDDTGELDLSKNPTFDKAVPDTAPGKQVAFSDRTVRVVLEGDRYVSVVPFVRAQANKRLEIPYDKKTMRKVGIQAVNRHEVLTFRDMLVPAAFDTASDPGDYTIGSTKLAGPLNEIIETAEGDIFTDLNQIVMNPRVARTLLETDELKAWNGRLSNNASSPMSMGKLRDYFLEDYSLELVIQSVKYTTKAGVRDYMFGDHIAVIRTADDGTPTFLTTYTNGWLTDGVSLVGVREFESNDPLGTVYEAAAQYRIQNDNRKAGGILQDVLT